MKSSFTIFVFFLICHNIFSQDTIPKRKAIFFHGGVGIPILLSTSGNDHSDFFNINKNASAIGLGFGYSKKFSKNLSYAVYLEMRQFGYDVGEMEKKLQVQNPDYYVIPNLGPDMFFSYFNVFIGLKYSGSINKFSYDLLLLTGPTLYFMAEPTVNLKEVGGNNIRTITYDDETGPGFSINPQIYFGYRIKKRLSLLVRCSYLCSSVQTDYEKHTSDLLDLSYSEHIKSKQRMNNLIAGIGFKIEF